MARLFISAETLDAWSADNRADLTGEVLTLDGQTFAIAPGVFFDKVAGDDSDPNDLLGKVKAADELASMGAEQYHNSVIVGETAYDVVCGFVGSPGGG